MSFFVTISCDMRFITMENIQSQKARNILKAINNVISIYYNQVFKVITFFMDQEVKSLGQKLLDMINNLKTASKSENITKVKHQNQLLKERFCACCHTLQFKVIAKLVLVEMMKYY